MTTPSYLSRRSFLGLTGAAASALLLGACGSGSGSGSSGQQTINWWHIQNTEPLKPLWAQFAKEYSDAHPGVTFKIEDYENDAFKSKLTTVTQAGNPPDLFQSWGGGVLIQQVEAGLVKDITDDVAPWISTVSSAGLQPYTVNGRIYGVPWDLGMVGFWYNKDHFAQAGITETPKTWTQFLDVVRKLKAAGLTPIALGGNDKWPGHFYWAYLAIRIAGIDALTQAQQTKSFDNPDFVTAGEKLRELVDLEPFQEGFLGAGYEETDGQAAAVGNGMASMELMGQWAPSVQKAYSKNGQGLGDKLGFFPFPEIEGGKGKATDAFGGGNGFAIGRNAPAATVDFLKFFMDVQQQRRAAATGAVLPTVKGAEDAITDENNKIVAQHLAQATGFQLYLDQAFPPAVGTQVNDSVAELIAGRKTPLQVTQEITKTAQSQ